jgi:hypothetical protein
MRLCPFKKVIIRRFNVFLDISAKMHAFCLSLGFSFCWRFCAVADVTALVGVPSVGNIRAAIVRDVSMSADDVEPAVVNVFAAVVGVHEVVACVDVPDVAGLPTAADLPSIPGVSNVSGVP